MIYSFYIFFVHDLFARYARVRTVPCVRTMRIVSYAPDSDQHQFFSWQNYTLSKAKI